MGDKEEIIPVNNQGVFTEKNKAKILGYLLKGMNRTDSCQLARVTYRTFCGWFNQGITAINDFENYDCPMTEFGQFSENVLFCEAKSRYDFLEELRAIAKKDPKQWTGVMTFMERQHPEQFGQRRQITATVDQKTEITVRVLDGEAWKSGGKMIVEDTNGVQRLLEE